MGWDRPRARRAGGEGDLPDLEWRRQVVLSELGMRMRWFIWLRWWVPPAIAAGVLLASSLGFHVPQTALLAVAVFILAYNAVFFALRDRFRASKTSPARSVQHFALLQVGLDYTAVFFLVHLTGGVTSPLILLPIFHIIIAAILLPPRYAYGFAAVVVFGMLLVSAAERLRWLPFHGLSYRSEPPPSVPALHHWLVALGAFAAAVAITAWMTTAIASMLRRRIQDLAEATRKVTALNERLEALYAMTQAIATRQRLGDVLHIVTLELCHVLDVQATSIKLLDDSGSRLLYAAEHGMPEGWTENKTIELARSPIHRRIMNGEPFVTGQVERSESLQFGEALTAAGFRSVLFVPLTTQDRVIGILGAYCLQPNRFTKADVEFFRLAADLVAMGIDNARAYEAMERASEHRARFMRQAAHNLRAPVAAVSSMVEVLREGYLGSMSTEQDEQLRRVQTRAEAMLALIKELLTLAASQQALPTDLAESINMETLARQLERTFYAQAIEREIALSIRAEAGLPELCGSPRLVEQILENLVSNALKYTAPGGHVDVVLAPEEQDAVCICVKDTGIGIPERDLPKLFTEFFRAANAKSFDQMGTGLGLAIVKEVAESMGGRVEVSSKENEGTEFVVHLPASPATRTAPSSQLRP